MGDETISTSTITKRITTFIIQVGLGFQIGSPKNRLYPLYPKMGMPTSSLGTMNDLDLFIFNKITYPLYPIFMNLVEKNLCIK